MFVACFHDFTIGKHMDIVRDDVVQKALVVGDNNHSVVLILEFVHSIDHNAQRIYIQALIRLVKDRNFRL